MIINITKVLNTIVPVLKIEICLSVDALELTLNSATSMLCRILLLILWFRSLMTNDILIQEVLDWFGVQGRIAIRLDGVGDTNISTMFL